MAENQHQSENEIGSPSFDYHPEPSLMQLHQNWFQEPVSATQQTSTWPSQLVSALRAIKEELKPGRDLLSLLWPNMFWLPALALYWTYQRREEPSAWYLTGGAFGMVLSIASAVMLHQRYRTALKDVLNGDPRIDKIVDGSLLPNHRKKKNAVDTRTIGELQADDIKSMLEAYATYMHGTYRISTWPIDFTSALERYGCCIQYLVLIAVVIPIVTVLSTSSTLLTYYSVAKSALVPVVDIVNTWSLVPAGLAIGAMAWWVFILPWQYRRVNLQELTDLLVERCNARFPSAPTKLPSWFTGGQP